MAGKIEQAAFFLSQAGEGAAKRYANDEAVEYFGRALGFNPKDDLEGRYDLLLARVKVLANQGSREAQKCDLTELKEIAEARDDVGMQAQIGLLYMIYYLDVGDFPTIEEMVDEAICLAKAAGDEEIEAEIYLSWGMSLWRQGRPKTARLPLEHALALALDLQLHQVEADSLRNLGTVCFYLLDSSRGLQLWEQALDKYRQIGDLRGEASVLNNLGVIMGVEMSDLASSIDYFEQALIINQEIGDRLGEGLTYQNLGEIALGQGDYAAAVIWLSQALEIQCEIGDRKFESISRLDLGHCHFDLGEYEEARNHFKQSSIMTREIGDLEGEIWGLLAWMNFHRELGDYRSAQTYYKQLKAVWNEVEAQWTKAEILFNFSLLKHHLGDNQAAQEYCNQGLQILGDYEKHWLRWFGLTYLGHVLAALEALDKAEEVYRQAISLGYETQKTHQAIEAQVGLVRVSMARGDTEQALTQVEEILMYLENEIPSMGHPLDGTIEPFRIYLTCYKVLKANDDLRADTILTEAYNLLQKRADNISDEHLRDCFLYNVVVNREIVEEYEAFGLEGGAPL
jgi:tetratricopeptide (TPR) repeat protein